ncbi:PTS system cellobiose-specific IIA component [Breznakia blatticola]|uniref:PTS system cellobiose-specific IIA component n=1 Tax=Breznakia blatticola TaxID=1754012 RepID=A0A4R7ZFN0_9FIRM|nr:PTS lactose/cellobiose transporter subunit IIA [Breznakia blatticola]TDW11402.1 PTS system cellobiose-specific IIA component [Breznakia blatticola]
MEGLELVSFQIISSAGGARSKYIEAIQEAKQGNFETADTAIKEGQEMFQNAHKAHASLIQEEAGGKSVNITLLLMHAEDQLMACDSFLVIANEFIDVYKNIK